jgi:hypothetical protein
MGLTRLPPTSRSPLQTKRQKENGTLFVWLGESALAEISHVLTDVELTNVNLAIENKSLIAAAEFISRISKHA